MTSLSRVFSSLRRCKAVLRGVLVPSCCRLERGVDLRPGIYAGSRGRIALGLRCELEHGALLYAYGGEIVLRENVYVGPYAVIYGHGGVRIGAHTLVSMQCRILSSEHTIPPAGKNIRDYPDVRLPTVIGADVWLGAGVTVLGGVTIGDGCVVGAGAVVTHDLPTDSVAVGVPARVTGQRNDSP